MIKEPTVKDCLKEINEEIKVRNKLFKGKSIMEKRVLIAKEVIEQVKAHKIKVKAGVFYESNDEYHISDKLNTTSFQKIFLDKEFECNCCALGSMLVGCTILNNKSKLGFNDEFSTSLGTYLFAKSDHYKVSNELDKIFDDLTLKKIEYCFELGSGYISDSMFATSHRKLDVSDDEMERLLKFGSKYKLNHNRLIDIMNNIVKNKGEFKV